MWALKKQVQNTLRKVNRGKNVYLRPFIQHGQTGIAEKIQHALDTGTPSQYIHGRGKEKDWAEQKQPP